MPGSRRPGLLPVMITEVVRCRAWLIRISCPPVTMMSGADVLIRTRTWLVRVSL